MPPRDRPDPSPADGRTDGRTDGFPTWTASKRLTLLTGSLDFPFMVRTVFRVRHTNNRRPRRPNGRGFSAGRCAFLLSGF